MMDGKTLKALIDAGAIKRVSIIANGCLFHIEAVTQTGPVIANTLKGKLKTWSSLDAAARWAHELGIGTLQLEIGNWYPGQKGLKL
jgi:hypothetical protein